MILEGNTLGVEAAKAIAKALESQPSFQRALWKDAFTGRLKDEIPKALVLTFFFARIYFMICFNHLLCCLLKSFLGGGLM